MVQVFVSDFDITRAEAVRFIHESALQHQGQFHPAMPVIRYRRAGRDIEQADRRFFRGGKDGLFDTHTDGAPFHLVQITANVVAQRCGQHRFRRLLLWLPDRVGYRARIDQSHGFGKAVVVDAGGSGFFQKRAAHAVKACQSRAAFIAHGHMRGDDQIERLGQVAS